MHVRASPSTFSSTSSAAARAASDSLLSIDVMLSAHSRFVSRTPFVSSVN